MKILVISQHFYPENFRFNDLALGLTEKDCELTVLTGAPNYPKGKIFDGYKLFNWGYEVFNGAKIFRCPLVPRGTSRVQLALNYISFPIFCTIYAFLRLRRKDYDHILVTQTSPIFMAIPAIILKFFWRKPFSLWITDLWPESLRATGEINNKRILYWVELCVRIIYRFSSQILISSKSFENSIREKGYLGKVIYFPYWAESLYEKKSLDSKEFPSEIKSLFDSTKRTITFAGNIGKAQNLPILIEALSLIQNKENVRLLIIGDGREKENLEKFVQIKNLGNHVVFTGSKPVEYMPYYFAISDILFMSLGADPIFSLTVPSKFQSYLACGKPLLASVNGEVRDLIQESGCGLSSAAENVHELAKNLEKMSLLDTEELTKYGMQGYDYFISNFARDLAMSNLIDHCKNVLK